MAEEFDWEETTKGYVLSSYFWGYIGPQTIGGIVSAKYGAAPAFSLGVVLAAVLCLAVPFVAKYPLFLIGLNASSGVINGFVCPAVSQLISKWAPPTERTKLVTLAYAGSPMGMALGQPLVGYICDSKLGWRGVYYFIFGINIIWYVWFYFYVYSTPQQDPHISEEEKQYIVSSIENSVKEAEVEMEVLDRESALAATLKVPKTKKNQGRHYDKLDTEEASSEDTVDSESSSNSQSPAVTPKPVTRIPIQEETFKLLGETAQLTPEIPLEFNNRDTRISRANLVPVQMIPPEIELMTKKTGPIPWKLLFSNPGVLTIFQLHFAGNWTWYTLMTYLPSFIKGTYNLSVTLSSILGLFPYLASCVFQIVISFLADHYIKQGKYQIVTIRKLFVIIGSFGCAITLMIAAYAKSLVLMIVSMTIAVGFSGISGAMQSANMMDISPHYAGIIMGISNTFATLPGILSPITTSYIVGKTFIRSDWQIVFWIPAVSMIVSAIIYLLFARGVSQRGM